MRRWIWFAVSGALALLGGAAFLAKPAAVSIAQSQAAARGLDLKMGDMRLGFLSARVTDARIRLQGVDAIEIRLNEVDVRLSLTAPRIREVRVLGGQVEIDGELDEVRRQLASFQSHRPSSEGKSAPASSARTESLRDIDIVWKGAFGDSTQRIEGLAVERSADGQRFGADLISLSLENLSMEVAGAYLLADAGGLRLDHVREAHAAEARMSYVAPRPNQDATAAKDGQNQSAARPQNDQDHDRAPDDGADSDDGSPGLARVLTPKPRRVTTLRAALELIRTRVLPRLPAEAEVERLWLTYRSGEERLHVGPNRLLAKNEPEGLSVALSPRKQAQGTPLSLSLKLPAVAEEESLTISLEGGPVSLSTLGISEGAMGLSGVERTTLSGTFQVNLSKDVTTIAASGQVALLGLTLDSKRLAEGLVAFPKVVASGKLGMSVDGSSYEVSDADFSLGQARMKGNFKLHRHDDSVKLEANVSAPLVSCQELLDSAPRGLLGAVEQMKFRGTFSFQAGVSADTKNLSAMGVRWDFKNGCHALRVPASLDPEQFRTSFSRSVVGAGNLPLELEFGPHSLDWTPYDEVSKYMEAALLVSEDGRFFRHDGFDDRAIEGAIRANTKAGSFIRGASTISMQLAKNLYLSRDKTLSRKFQEAALTSLLEQTFSKQELLELYMNVIEYGPGVYGIRNAARYYFHSMPRHLSAAQAFFLASILPAPALDYFTTDGVLTDGRRTYVKHLLEVAHKRGRLTDEELENALSEELRFGQASTSPPPSEQSAADGLSDAKSIPEPAALLPRALGSGAAPAHDLKETPVEPPPKGEPSTKQTPPATRQFPKVDPARRGIHL